MDLDAREREDEERFEAMRAKMRAHVEQVCADYMERANPVTPAEVRSHLWTVAVADRTLSQLYDLPQRRGPRSPAKSKPAPSSPPYAKQGEVARNVAPEGSAPSPQPAPPPTAEPVPSPLQQLNTTLATANDKIDQVTLRCAEWAGLWPDGTPFEDAGPDWRAHTDARPLAVDMNVDDEADLTRLMTDETLRRCNAIARQCARFMGCWFDASAFDEGDSDFWTISANFGTDISRPAANEAASPSCLPWWIVKTRPT